MTELRILLIEDNADDAELIALELEDAGFSHQLHRVELRNELDAALERDDWSLVLCDSRLPGYSGAEAFAWVRERMPFVPFLFCTGGMQVDDPLLADAIEQAHGWVSKDRLTQLPSALKAALGNSAT